MFRSPLAITLVFKIARWCKRPTDDSCHWRVTRRPGVPCDRGPFLSQENPPTARPRDEILTKMEMPKDTGVIPFGRMSKLVASCF